MKLLAALIAIPAGLFFLGALVVLLIPFVAAVWVIGSVLFGTVGGVIFSVFILFAFLLVLSGALG